MSEKPQVVSELSRDLSLFHIMMMGLGMMIGAGVFLGTGRSIAFVGPGGALLTFALNGVVALFTAMSYAELSSAIPRAGGAYNFARIGFGRGTSFIAGWMEWFASSVAGALYAVCFATYTVRFVVGMGLVNIAPEHHAWLVKGVAAAVAMLFIYINYRGASETGKIGAVMTLGQTALLVVIGGVGVVVALRDPERFANFSPFLNPANGWTGLLVTMGFTAVAFEGYEVIAQAGDEAINPRSNIPKAMLYSVLIVTLTYLGCAFAVVVGVKAGPGIVPWQFIGSFGGAGFGESVERLIPHGGSLLVMLAVLFASTSALNATIYSATRASYALGRDRMLPGFFARISTRRKTPWVALGFTGAIVLVVATCLDVDQVASSASIMFLFLFFLVNLCVIRIRYNMGDELKYGFLMPFFPVLPIVAIVCQALLAVFLHELGPAAWILAPLWVGAGVLLYVCYSKSRATPSEDEIRILEEEPAGDGEGYRIMVAVANPDNALALVRTTWALCGAKQAGVQLLHMVSVPDQIRLSDAERYMSAGKEAIIETMLYLSPMFPISSTIRYCRNIARGIVAAVREKNTDLLIMGWHGRSRSRAFTLGSTVDPVIERVPCNVVILKNVGTQKFKRVLVPVAGGPNSEFALEIASILADREEGEVVVLTVQTRGAVDDFDLEAFVFANRDRLALPPERLRAKSVSGAGVAQAILAESQNEQELYDLVVLGATGEHLLSQFVHESVPEHVAKACRKPLIMVKTSGGLSSWVKRWL